MAKLYPPYINGTIPAFYYTGGTVEITVPFTMNRAVAISEIAGFALKIKTNTGKELAVKQKMGHPEFTTSSASITFEISDIKFQLGQYYKIQLAYISGENNKAIIGYYSTVGIIKCTTQPSVTIAKLSIENVNPHIHSYVGVYSQYGKDVTEKLYSYRFRLLDHDKNIIIDSGEKLHNTILDTSPYEAHEQFFINQDLKEGEIYYLQFIAITTNKVILSSPEYRLTQRNSVASDIRADLNASFDFENACVNLSLFDEVDKVITGSFLLSRACSKDNYIWEEVKRFNLVSLPPTDWFYTDYTVEQGMVYKYCLQQYNANGVYSKRITSNSVNVDFEDSFLYDGDKQLKIRFNPQVGTYKTNILENKTETIGSKYPWFSRNGNVNYKEFSISGLISYLSDEAEKFVSMKELGLDGFLNIDSPYGKYRTTNLVDYNITAERIFKNKVLDWLNDGKVKLFKTPTEGNYLVRLMGASLSPNTTVGRMLHDFSVSAYEVAECNSESLNYYGIIDSKEPNSLKRQWVTVDIAAMVEETLGRQPADSDIGKTIVLNPARKALDVDFKDMIPGARVYIDKEPIQIGVTGAYYYSTGDNETTINSIKYVIDSVNEGQLTYSFLAQNIGTFGLIDGIELIDVPVRQFIGIQYYPQAHQWDSSIGAYGASTFNLMDVLNDVRSTVSQLVFIRAEKRPVETLYVKINSAAEREQFKNYAINNGINYMGYTYYTNMYCDNNAYKFNFNDTTRNPLTLYRISFGAERPEGLINYQQYGDATVAEHTELTDIYIDGSVKAAFKWTDDLFSFTINDEVIDLTDKETYFLKCKDVNISNILLHNGITFEVSYTEQIKQFNIENDASYATLRAKKQAYNNIVKSMINTRKKEHYTGLTILHNAYQDYLLQLNQDLDKYRKENGLVE